MANPKPFTSPRIAFLNQSWVNCWHLDYRQFAINPKKFLFGEAYAEVMMGRYPADTPTNKEWVKDVDHVYFCHNINIVHWVGVHANLIRHHIDVYDSIIGSTSDKQMVEEITPYTRMIPYMLRSIALITAKKNIALKKYTVFARLFDENMPFIQKKMVVEIYVEVPDDHNQMSNPVPHSKNKDKLLLLTDSLN
ncbi:unnamed protein product [Cochlearia groenlandica]